jgi:hypothetical protein
MLAYETQSNCDSVMCLSLNNTTVSNTQTRFLCSRRVPSTDNNRGNISRHMLSKHSNGTGRENRNNMDIIHLPSSVTELQSHSTLSCRHFTLCVTTRKLWLTIKRRSTLIAKTWNILNDAYRHHYKLCVSYRLVWTITRD